MKIIQIIPDLGFGGAEIMAENLIYKLKEKGHTILVVSLFNNHSEIAKRIEKNRVKIIYLNKKNGIDLLQIYKLYKLLKQEKPDVVHTHRHCTVYAFPAAVMAGVSAKVHTLHNIAKKENTKIHRKINKFYFRHFQVIPVALSQNIRNTVVDEYFLEPENIPIIFNGIDISKCKIKKYTDLHDPIQIIHIGRFAHAKNHINIIKAFKLVHEKYSNCELLLLGEGELKKQIADEVKENNLVPFIHFVGQTSDVFSYLHNSDIFILPSIYEGMPITIIEAMGTGIPIIAAPVGGVSEMVRNNEEALYCDTTPDSIAQTILKLLESEKLRKKISQNELHSVNRFTSEEMANQYLKLYQTLLNRKSTKENK